MTFKTTYKLKDVLNGHANSEFNNNSVIKIENLFDEEYCSQIRIKTISKTIQHFIDIRFKLCSNYVQIDQISVENRLNIDPKSIPNRSTIVQIGL